MSIKLFSFVWELQLPMSRKMVLLSLADQANDAGEAFPSFANIMRRCGMARRTLFECLLDLERDGFITRIPVGLQKVIFQVNEEILRQRELLESPRKESVKPVRQPHQCENRTGADNRKNTGKTGAPDALHKATLKSKSNRSIAQHSALRFEEFWNAYPKRVGRKPALEKWKAKRLDAIADKLIADVTNRLANDGRWLDGFVPDPRTYLTQERWNDELQPRREPPPATSAPSSGSPSPQRDSETPLERACAWARQQHHFGAIDEAERDRLIAEATERYREREEATA